MKVGLYLRVSTQEQAEEGYSIGEQETRLTKYADAHEWEVYKIYRDAGFSGGDMERPALKTMINDVQDGLIDKVVVYKLDRLSRSQFDTLYLIEKVFLTHNTDFVSMTENFDTSTPFGRAMIGILAVFAQLEREKIKERMVMGKEARAKLGLFNGGTEPIGYDYNSTDDMLYPNEYELMQIAEARELFLKGTPLRTIERIFLKKGYKQKHGVWDAKQLRRTLRSKLYLGYMNYKGVWYKAPHAVTCDKETYDKCVKLLDQRAEAFKKTGVKAGVVTTNLGGLLYCKHCGGKYHKRSNYRKKEGAEEVLWYTCYSRSKSVKKMIKDPNCVNKNWKIEELDNLVFEEIRKLALDPEYFKQIRADKREKEKETPNRIHLIEAEIEKVSGQISRFMDLYGIGKFTVAQVSEKVDPLNDQLRALQRELDSLNAEAGRLTEEEALELINSFDEVLKSGEFEKIRGLIELLISFIEIDNEDIYIHWKFA